MKSIAILAATALFSISAVPLHASCTFPLTLTVVDKDNGVVRLSWQTVVGASQYEVQSTFDDNFVNTKTLEILPFGTNEITVTQKLSRVRTGVGYRVIASDPNNPRDIQCSGTTTSGILNESRLLQHFLRRTVLPVVGSTPGLNNAQFKTSLRLGPGVQSGRIVFHPAGQAASENDPSIPYNVVNETLEYDDIVAALGASGIGSLDIVPLQAPFEATILPVEVRLFNESPGGTFGAFESPVQPFDVFQPQDWTVYVPASRFRVNIGVRTLTATSVTFVHLTAAGGRSQKSLDLPADYVFMDAAEHFFNEPVAKGDTIVIHFASTDAFAIPFHTFTDNSTNDPSVFNPQSPSRTFYPDLEVVTVTPQP
jgi:hypothetical protein